jgi:caffeoyl-CoA O-methyltransferase
MVSQMGHHSFWGERVADEAAQDEDTMALRALNAKLRAVPRVSLSVLLAGDGLTSSLKRG